MEFSEFAEPGTLELNQLLADQALEAEKEIAERRVRVGKRVFFDGTKMRRAYRIPNKFQVRSKGIIVSSSPELGIWGVTVESAHDTIGLSTRDLARYCTIL